MDEADLDNGVLSVLLGIERDDSVGEDNENGGDDDDGRRPRRGEGDMSISILIYERRELNVCDAV